MTATAEPALYGLVGHPVAHSLSPLIYKRFAEQSGRHIDYVLIDVAPGEFRTAVPAFRHKGGKGLNVTLPYKADAFEIAARLSDRARAARAVNTLAWIEEDTLFGDNTDGAGLVTDLQRNLDFQPAGRRILIMGAGGAARGALQPLLDSKPARLIIANRTLKRAAALAASVSPAGVAEASAYDRLEGPFDLIVNATSASLAGEVPPIPVAAPGADCLCYDMYYTAGPTAFLKWAAKNGCTRLADGAGMLVEQAAESFRLWHGLSPDTKPVLDEIRRTLG